MMAATARLGSIAALRVDARSKPRLCSHPSGAVAAIDAVREKRQRMSQRGVIIGALPCPIGRQ